MAWIPVLRDPAVPAEGPVATLPGSSTVRASLERARATLRQGFPDLFDALEAAAGDAFGLAGVAAACPIVNLLLARRPVDAACIAAGSAASLPPDASL